MADARRPRVLDTLLAWKSAQYRETGVWDRFDQPWIVDVVRALAATSSDRLTGCSAPCVPASTSSPCTSVCSDTIGSSGGSPPTTPPFGSYSPGLILLLDLVAEAAARGLTLVDLGRGEHHYKLRVANGAYDVAEGVVPADRA